MSQTMPEVRYQEEIESIEGTVFAPDQRHRTDDLRSIWDEIGRLGLEKYVAEFEARGYTIIPPDKLAPAEFIDRIREKILDISERRNGVRPDLYGASTQGSGANPQGASLFYLLYEDPVFQRAVVNPTLLALAYYALGKSAVLYNCMSLLKGPGGQDLPLHSDNLMIPAPFAPYAQIVNFTWLLTDYSRENGATCFVPGSHRYARHPEPGEGVAEREAAEAPAGSMLMWHGNTWHGGLAKQTPGLRMAFLTGMCRSYIRPEENYLENVTPQILERNPAAFAQLVGVNHKFGWTTEGPDYTAAGHWPGKSQWD
ncbi:MAG TPA: phytanoyl-CoA dioxygenase family protein [Pseudonocardia sp.]